MSTPFNPNQQPMPGNGQFPTGQQFGAGYGQQPGQQMPSVGGYGQPQGFGQQPQQGFYPQGQFQGTPYGGAPEKKTGLIVGIIAAVLVVAIIVGVVIWALNKDDSDSAAGSPAMPGVPSQGSDPAAGTNPMQPPVGANPSQGAAPGNGSGGQEDTKQKILSICKEQINKNWANANISNENFAQPEINANGEKHVYTGIVTGTDTKTNKTGRWAFTCNGYYIKSYNDYGAWITYKEA